MMAIRGVDPFLQARIEDKADMLDVLEKQSESITKRLEHSEKKAAVAVWMILVVFVATIIICINIAGCSIKSGVERAQEKSIFKLDDKWHTLPPAPDVPFDYNYGKAMQDCMQLLVSRRMVSDWTGEGEVNCRDWTMAFLVNWYFVLNQPDGTCFPVWNDDYVFFDGNTWSHMFVAVWDGAKWRMVEPQACMLKDWSVKKYWGSKYDEKKNIYNMTTEIIDSMAGAQWNLKQKIKQKTLSENFYGKKWWSETD